MLRMGFWYEVIHHQYYTTFPKKCQGVRNMNNNKNRRGTAGKVTFDLFMAVYAAASIYAGAVIVPAMCKDIGTTEEVIQAEAPVQTAAAVHGGQPAPSTNKDGMEVPKGDTAFKSYMSYRAITNTDSSQYKLQKRCWTDGNGLRRYKTYYVVALGSYYADHIGERFRITTTEGNEFECIVGDFKADRHTDSLHQYTPMEGRKCVVEFVVDTYILDKTAKKMGDISYIEGFGGDIESIENMEGQMV